jgi:hypothetical protein
MKELKQLLAAHPSGEFAILQGEPKPLEIRTSVTLPGGLDITKYQKLEFE